MIFFRIQYLGDHVWKTENSRREFISGGHKQQQQNNMFL